jgi:hypothetical protein
LGGGRIILGGTPGGTMERRHAAYRFHEGFKKN